MKFLEQLDKIKARQQVELDIAKEEFKTGLTERVLSYLDQFSKLERIGELHCAEYSGLYRLRSAANSSPSNCFVINLEGILYRGLKDDKQEYCEVNAGLIFEGNKDIIRDLSFDPKKRSIESKYFSWIDIKNNLEPITIYGGANAEGISVKLFSWVRKFGFTREEIEVAGGWADDLIIDTPTGENEGHICGMDVGYEAAKKVTTKIESLK